MDFYSENERNICILWMHLANNNKNSVIVGPVSHRSASQRIADFYLY